MKTQLGKQKRLDRILGNNGKAFIVPIDDLLICGSDFQLMGYKEKIASLEDAPIDAVLGFPGVFEQFYGQLHNKPWILNLTTSTIRHEHTFKRLSGSIENAIAKGAEAVAVHVNVTSPAEGEQIRNLSEVSEQCDRFGIPLMAIVYARGVKDDGTDDNYLELRNKDNATYTALVSHACRIAVELGADIIKTNFTGSVESFAKVVYSAGSIPVVIAGGVQVDEEIALENVRNAMQAGASGICFGRNFFYRDDILTFSQKVKDIIHEF
jgi:DhnA family fructose-bisphosphate aldolase class Ia